MFESLLNEYFDHTPQKEWSIIGALRYIEPKTEILSIDTINTFKTDLYSLLRSISEKCYAHEFAKKKANKILSNYDGSFSSLDVKRFIDEIGLKNEKKEFQTAISRHVTSTSTLQALGEYRKSRIAIENMRNEDVREASSAIEDPTVTTTKRFLDEKERTTKRARICKGRINEDIENNPFIGSSEKSSNFPFQDQLSLSGEKSNDEFEDDESGVTSPSPQLEDLLSPPQKHIDEANISNTSEEIDGDRNIYNDPRDVSPSLISIMREYCKKDSTSKFDPAHSYILDLTPTSKIMNEFTPKHWSELVADRPEVDNVDYYKELDSIFDHLFGQSGKRSTIKNIHQARNKWKNIRNIEPPEHKEEFSYDKDDWEKILWWIEWAVGRFLSAFESERNPLIQHDCHEREWLGGYLVPIFQGALVLDGCFRVPWGEVTVQSSLQRRNRNKKILEEKLDRGHLADLLCHTDFYEVLCLLACGGPHKVDLTKLASDEFQLPRIMKDSLDDMREKFNNTKKEPTYLFTIGIQQYKSEIRVYLMERRDVYRFHLIKTFCLPLTFTNFNNLRISLSWAWNIRGLLNDLFNKLADNEEIGSTIQQSSNDIATSDTPSRTKKKKSDKGK